MWRHQDGSVDEDVMRRRVTPIAELTDLLTGAGFTDIASGDTFVVANKG